MDDFIDRAALRVKLLKLQMEAQEDGDPATAGAMRLIREFVDREPKAEVEPVKYARWIALNEEGKYLCSGCSSETRVEEVWGKPKYRRCPECGAQMEAPHE